MAADGPFCQRDPQLGVQLDGERDGPGAELHAGRAQSVGGLEAVAALHAAPTLRTVADLDVEAAYDGVTVSVEPSWRRARCGTCGKRAPRYDRQPVRM